MRISRKRKRLDSYGRTLLNRVAQSVSTRDLVIRVRQRNRYSDIRERVGRDGQPFLIITREVTYTNQTGALLCITRQSSIRR